MTTIVGGLFEALSALIKSLLTLILHFLVACFTGDELRPTIAKFTEQFLGGNPSNMDKILEFSTDAGLILAIVLTVLTLGLMYLSGFIELKENIVQYLARFIGTGIMIYIISDIGAYLFDLVNILYDGATLVSSELSGTSGVSSAFDDMASNFGLDDIAANIAILASGTAFTVDIIVSIVETLIDIILYIVIGYNFLKLCIEMVQRYVTMFALYMGLPAAASLLGSYLTQNMFFSYMQMIGCEMAVFITMKIWLRLSLFVLNSVNTDIIGIFGALAFIRVGISLQSIFRNMGFSIAQTGPALLDSAATTIGALGFMTRNAMNGLGTVGNGMVAFGSKKGDIGMVKAGMFMKGQPVNTQGALQAMNTNWANNPSKYKPQNVEAQITPAMDELRKSGNMMSKNTLTQTYNNLKPGERQKYLDHVLNDSFGDMKDKIAHGGHELRLTDYDANRGQFKAEIRGEDGQFTGYIGNTQDSKAISSFRFTGADGTSNYLNITDMSPMQEIQGNIYDGSGDPSLANDKNSGLKASDVLTTADLAGIDSDKVQETFITPGQNGAEDTVISRGDFIYTANGSDSNRFSEGTINHTGNGQQSVVGVYDNEGITKVSYDGMNKKPTFVNEFKQSIRTSGGESRRGAFADYKLEVDYNSIKFENGGKNVTFEAKGPDGKNYEFEGLSYADHKAYIDSDRRYVVRNGLALKRGRCINSDNKKDAK